jgi:signal transduction histidine kinase/ligand-binding sensor domain-containing protein
MKGDLSLRCLRQLTVTLLCFVCAAGANALDPSRSLSQYVHKSWNADNGFLGGTVYAICQSQDGYLWFGTERGLVRFDGVDFSLIQRPVPNFGPIGAVRGLVSDVHGNLWIRLDGPSLLRYRDGVFEDAAARYSLYDTAFTAMTLDVHGEMLLWGVMSQTMRFRNDRFERSPASEAISGVAISGEQIRDGSIWVGTRDSGLFKIQDGNLNSVLPSSIGSVNALAVAEHGGVWVGTDNGLLLWDGSRLSRPASFAQIAKLQILTVIRDRQGNLWAGTNHGLVKISPSLEVSADFLQAGSATKITAVYEDRDGDVWFGGQQGIERLRDGMFTQFSIAAGNPTRDQGPVYVDEEGRTWFAPVSGGLWWLKQGHTGHVTLDGLGNDVIYSISGGGGEVWLGRQQGGLTELTSSDEGFVAHTFTHADGLAQNSVFSVHRNRDGTVWAGTVSAGISVLKHGIFTNYSVANILGSDAIFSVDEGFDGTMWIASPGGLASYSSGRWSEYKTADGQPLPDVHTTIEDAHHVLWLATSTGLAYLNDGQIKLLRGVPEQLREEVLGIAQDKDGFLWIVTSDHVIRVNREELLADSVEDSSIVNYGASDGLTAYKGSRRDRPVVADSAGRIWLSLARGVAVGDLSKSPGYTSPVGVHIESVLAGGRAVNLGEGMNLPAGTQTVTFRYADTNLSVPDRIRFRYRLEGSDHGWNNVADLREAAYTHLGPGHYRFHIAASNGVGEWNGLETTLPFVIEPALWQTWYFQLACWLLLLSLAAFAYRWRLALLSAQMNWRFQDRLDERERIARDLHDTFFQSIQGLLLSFNTATSALPKDEPTRKILEATLIQSDQVMLEGRQLVLDLRGTKSQQSDLPQELAEYGSRMQKDYGITFELAVQGTIRHLHPIASRDLCNIAKEALCNAFRHSEGRSIEVELTYDPIELRIRVRDDGIGIDPKILKQGSREGHWGLPGMRERAKKIGANFEIWSGTGTGTEIELRLASNIAYTSNSQKRALDGLCRLWNRRRGANGEKPM